MDDDEDYQARFACQSWDWLSKTCCCRKRNPWARSSLDNAGKCHGLSQLQLRVASLCLAALQNSKAIPAQEANSSIGVVSKDQ